MSSAAIRNRLMNIARHDVEKRGGALLQGGALIGGYDGGFFRMVKGKWREKASRYNKKHGLPVYGEAPGLEKYLTMNPDLRPIYRQASNPPEGYYSRRAYWEANPWKANGWTNFVALHAKGEIAAAKPHYPRGQHRAMMKKVMTNLSMAYKRDPSYQPPKKAMRRPSQYQYAYGSYAKPQAAAAPYYAQPIYPAEAPYYEAPIGPMGAPMGQRARRVAKRQFEQVGLGYY
jgi:hypothetical protein